MGNWFNLEFTIPIVRHLTNLNKRNVTVDWLFLLF